jgi:anti-sigma factor RsiW
VKPELSHDEAFAALDAAALDALEAVEREAVFAHVALCAACAAELEMLRATVANLAFAAPLAADSATATRNRIGARLTARAAADARSRGLAPGGSSSSVAEPPSVTQPVPQSPQLSVSSSKREAAIVPRRRAEWLAIAASVLVVVSGGLLWSTLRDRDNLRTSLNVQLATSQRAQQSRDSLRAVVASRDSLLAGMTGRDVAVMTLTSSAARAPFAWMFWDKKQNTWTLIAHNMPQLKAGRTYQLWLVTPTAKISAGTFDPQNGDAVVRATYALAPNSLEALAVTEEPTGGMPQPTGDPVVAVRAGK